MFEEYVREQGLVILLCDTTLDLIRKEVGGSHDDGSIHEFDLVMTHEGLAEKCYFCGQVRDIE